MSVLLYKPYLVEMTTEEEEGVGDQKYTKI